MVGGGKGGGKCGKKGDKVASDEKGAIHNRLDYPKIDSFVFRF